MNGNAPLASTLWSAAASAARRRFSLKPTRNTLNGAPGGRSQKRRRAPLAAALQGVDASSASTNLVDALEPPFIPTEGFSIAKVSLSTTMARFAITTEGLPVCIRRPSTALEGVFLLRWKVSFYRVSRSFYLR